MGLKIKLVLIFLLLLFPLPVQAAQEPTHVNLFQITTDGSQQKDPLIYKNKVVYDSLGDIWGFNLDTKVNYPVIEKPGQQYVTGFFKNLIVYEDINEIAVTSDVRLYNLETGKDKVINEESSSYGGGVTNGRFVAYIKGGACGNLYLYNIKKQTSNKIFDLTCSPLRISDDTLIFASTDPQGTNITGYNLKTNKLFDVIADPGYQESANIFKDKVVYLEYLSGPAYGDYNAIKMKDLKTGEKKTIYESTTTTIQWPAVSGKYVVWSESSAQHVNGVKAANLKTGEVFEVQPQGPHQNSHTQPSIWKNTAVWMSWRTGNGDIYGAEFSK